MSSVEVDPVELVRQALEEETETAPKERFEALVRAGVIHPNGQLVRDDPPSNGQPPPPDAP